MILVNCKVTDILNKPKYVKAFDFWIITVVYFAFGRLSKTELTFRTKEECDSVKYGYEFLN